MANSVTALREAASVVASRGDPPRRNQKRRIVGSTQLRELLTEAIMVGPALILVLSFVLVPIVIAVVLSFTDWNGFNPPNWIGFRNYLRLTSDPNVATSAMVTLIITACGAVLLNVVGLGVALLVNGRTRFNSLMRLLAFYPHVVGPVIVGFLWAAILGTNGAINGLLSQLDLGKIPFLSSPTWALASTVGVIVWGGFGVNVILYLSALQTIPDSLIEASRIDGASTWQIFWKVKLPLLAPTVTVNVVLVVISLLRVYEIVLTLTGGGPAGSTSSIVYSILSTSFASSQLGYGAAQSVVLLILIIAASISIVTIRRRSEEAVAA